MVKDKISIMLVDDNGIDLFIHNELIKPLNIAHTISQYLSANEALKFLEAEDSTKWPQLILLDIRMPIMDGFDFLNKYATFPESLRSVCEIIVVSSSLDPGDKLKAKESPLVLELMPKPLDTDRLLTLLKNHSIL